MIRWTIITDTMSITSGTSASSKFFGVAELVKSFDLSGLESLDDFRYCPNPKIKG